MAQVEVKVEQDKPEEEQHRLVALVRHVLLAAVGAVALSQEELEKFVAKLVERGEIAEKDGKKLVRDMAARRRTQTVKVEEQLDKRIEEILARMNVPAKGDIDALGAKIAALTKKVDELKKG
jgi:poly(hydroxyalkanoate) granule-associated protein